MAKRKVYTEELRQKIVKEAIDTGESSLVARRYDINPVLLSRWLTSYKKHGLTTKEFNEKKREYQSSKASELEKENKKLKKELEEQKLTNEILADLVKKTLQRGMKE